MEVFHNLGVMGVQHPQQLLYLFAIQHVYKYHKHVVLQRGKVIVEDAKHPLHPNYEILPSGLRLRSIRCRTARYSKSFVPSNS